MDCRVVNNFNSLVGVILVMNLFLSFTSCQILALVIAWLAPIIRGVSDYESIIWILSTMNEVAINSCFISNVFLSKICMPLCDETRNLSPLYYKTHDGLCSWIFRKFYNRIVSKWSIIILNDNPHYAIKHFSALWVGYNWWLKSSARL